MKLIENMVKIEVDEESYIIINTLNGLIDLIGVFENEMLEKWSTINNIKPVGDRENALYNNLRARGYLVKNVEEESVIKISLIEELKKNREKTQKVRHMEFTLTYNCNFRCPYCFERERAPSTRVMSKEMVDAAFNLVGDEVEQISLFGGEPLLPGNRDIVEYIFSRAGDKSFFVTTNGYYLLEYMDFISKVKKIFIQVTIDGKEKTHNSLRYLADGGPTYYKILNGVICCLEKNIPVSIRMNLNPENVDECIEQRKMMLETLPNAKDYLQVELHPILQLDLKARNEVLKKILNVTGYPVRFGIPLMNSFQHGVKLKPQYNYCHAHDHASYNFDSLGNIYTCKAVVGRSDLSVGTYYPKVDFKKKSMLHRNVETIEACRNCNYAFICAGGCPLTLEIGADIFTPCCNRNKNDIHVVIPRLYNMYIGKRKRAVNG